jgi:hypothetical protein
MQTSGNYVGKSVEAGIGEIVVNYGGVVSLTTYGCNRNLSSSTYRTSMTTQASTQWSRYVRLKTQDSRQPAQCRD